MSPKKKKAESLKKQNKKRVNEKIKLNKQEDDNPKKSCQICLQQKQVRLFFFIFNHFAPSKAIMPHKLNIY